MPPTCLILGGVFEGRFVLINAFAYKLVSVCKCVVVWGCGEVTGDSVVVRWVGRNSVMCDAGVSLVSVLVCSISSSWFCSLPRLGVGVSDVLAKANACSGILECRYGVCRILPVC